MENFYSVQAGKETGVDSIISSIVSNTQDLYGIERVSLYSYARAVHEILSMTEHDSMIYVSLHTDGSITSAESLTTLGILRDSFSLPSAPLTFSVRYDGEKNRYDIAVYD